MEVYDIERERRHDRYDAESERLASNGKFAEATELGLVRHVTEIGATRNEIDGRIPQFGNCTACQAVGVIYDLCPSCNSCSTCPAVGVVYDLCPGCSTDRDGRPFEIFEPFWTRSHCYVNPRLIAKAFGNSTVPYIPKQRVFLENGDDMPGTYDLFVSSPIAVLTTEAINGALQNRLRASRREDEVKAEELLRYISNEEWELAYRHYHKNRVDIGDEHVLKGIDFIDNPVKPPRR